MPRGIKGSAKSIEDRRTQKKEYMRVWRDTHPEHVEKYRVWAKSHYKGNNTRYVKYARRDALKRKYGISIEDYDTLLIKQDGLCAICSNPPGKYRLVVDHNHITKQIRALLCHNCNAALGLMKEMPERLRSAALYVESWQLQ